MVTLIASRVDDMASWSATELSHAIRSRRVSAVEALDEHLARIERFNPELNAIVTLNEAARDSARAADQALARGAALGELHGVPVTIKDALETAALRTTCGYPGLSEHVPRADAPAVARLKAAGAIIVGKTNVPELSTGAQTFNPIFGRTNNPWDLGRTPGGSSGGGAAATAAGLTSFDLGADLGGSLRLPASFCGLYTLKATERRISTLGHIPPLPGNSAAVRQMNVIGPLTRSLDDLWLVLRLISGPVAGDGEVPPVPLKPLPDLSLRQLRLAWTADFGTLSVSPSIRLALEKLAGELERRGARVEELVPPGFDVAEAVKAWETMAAVERNWTLPTARELCRALIKRDALLRALDSFLEPWDALLCPTAACPAFHHCPIGEDLIGEGQTMSYHAALLPFQVAFNVTGNPVVALPLGRSPLELPFGLQVVGRRWEDERLLAISHRVDEILGPPPRPPGY